MGRTASAYAPFVRSTLRPSEFLKPQLNQGPDRRWVVGGESRTVTLRFLAP